MSTLTVSLIQTHLHWEDKDANLKMFSGKIDSIAAGTQLVVLPEMFSTGFSMNPAMHAESMDGRTVNWMKEIAARKKFIITGSIIIEEDGNYYNRLIWMMPNGKSAWYDKRHRFGFAGEDQHYASGNKRLIVSVNGWKINLLVCYDLRFPVWSRQNFLAVEQHKKYTGSRVKTSEYDCIIYVANWPERRNNAWRVLLQARAIENQSYVIGVNRIGKDGNDINHIGNSMVVDPMGEIIYCRENEEDAFTFTLEKSKLEDIRNKFPFLKDADDFIIEI